MKRIAIILVILAALAGGSAYFMTSRKAADAESGPKYEFDSVARRSIMNLVSATGTIAARDVVEVGTQVSGTLSQILADFNDTVEEGQLIALIDPSVLDAQVKIAQADLLRTQAQLQLAQNNLERFRPVHERGYLADNDFEPYRIAVQTAEANVLSSEANLDRARQNRGYAEIRAPIAGIVIDRSVEPGQTVAASLSAPRLFTIANDLSKMEILANVDESDIGQIKVGQTVRFTVAAYLDDTFTGTVEQIRLSPAVVQNVVNYTVVVTVDNPEGRLLPGMTATVDFIIEEVENVLSVPTAALNLRPDEAMLAVLQERRAQRQAQQGGGDSAGGGVGGMGGRPGNPGGPGGRPNIAMLWYLEDGQLQMIPVRKGVTDGVYAEVTPLRDAIIAEDLPIISKVISPAAATAAGGSQDGPPSGLRRLGF